MGREEARPALAGSEDGGATSQRAWAAACAGHGSRFLHRLRNEHSLSDPPISFSPPESDFRRTKE